MKNVDPVILKLIQNLEDHCFTLAKKYDLQVSAYPEDLKEALKLVEQFNDWYMKDGVDPSLN